MKVVILAADKGIRLREETEYSTKALTQIGGMPVILHIMNIYAHYGFKEFVLCIGELGSEVKYFFQENKYRTADLQIKYVDVGDCVMTGTILAKAKQFLNKGESFFLTYCDTISMINMRNLAKYHRAMGRVVTVTGAHLIPPQGVLEVDEGLAQSFEYLKPLSGLINGGFFVCDYEVFDYLEPIREFMFEEVTLPKLIDEKQLAVFENENFWYRIDTYKDIDLLEKIWRQGKAEWRI